MYKDTCMKTHTCICVWIQQNLPNALTNFLCWYTEFATYKITSIFRGEKKAENMKFSSLVQILFIPFWFLSCTSSKFIWEDENQQKGDGDEIFALTLIHT